MQNYLASLIGSGVILVTPTADGTAGQGLKTDGAGNLSFVSFALAGHTHTTDEVAEGSNLYFTNARADARITAQKGAANGLATLGADSKIPSSQLPAIAVTDTFVVASQAAMLALTAQTGDVAVRTDTNTTYILKGTDPSVLADWELLRTPTDTVLSVNGYTGAVTLTNTDVGAAATSHTHAASDIASGTIATARLGSGTANSSTFLRGDQSWSTPSGGTPGGSATELQYRSGASTFGAVAGSAWDGTNLCLTTGKVGINKSSSITGQIHVVSSGATVPAIIATQAASSTADYITCYASDGTTKKAYIDSTGYAYSKGLYYYTLAATGLDFTDLSDATTFLGTGGRVAAIGTSSSAGIRIRSSYYFSWSSDADTRTSSDTFISRNAAANIQLGATASATPVAQTLSVQNASGTNISGASTFSICASAGTGTGTPGDIALKTSTKAASGTTAQSQANRVTVKGHTGNVLVGLSSEPSAGGAPVLVLVDAVSDPTGMPANSAGVFAKSGEGYMVDAAGNVTLQTPHSTAIQQLSDAALTAVGLSLPPGVLPYGTDSTQRYLGKRVVAADCAALAILEEVAERVLGTRPTLLAVTSQSPDNWDEQHAVHVDRANAERAAWQSRKDAHDQRRAEWLTRMRSRAAKPWWLRGAIEPEPRFDESRPDLYTPPNKPEFLQ